MTPEDAAREALRGRTRLINDTAGEIRRLLERAASDIQGVLAGAPSDYQRWYLPQLLAEIRRVLDSTGAEAAAVAERGQQLAWAAGQALPDEVVTGAIMRASAAGAPVVYALLPALDTGQLAAMRAFLTEKVTGVTLDAANKINSALAMVVIGAETPFDAIKRVQDIIGDQAGRRATMIVHTELGRAYSTASQARMSQWTQAVPGLRKKWVQSGKLHPRLEHSAINGQEQPVDRPFVLEGGRVTMMHPHDPQAPARHTINCGCVSIPVLPKDNPYGLKSTIEDPEAVEAAQAREALKAAAAADAGAARPRGPGRTGRKPAGSRHAGWIAEFAGKSPREIEKSLRSLRKQVALHEAKIANPEQYIDNSAIMGERERVGLVRKWQKDIDRQQEHIAALEDLLKQKRSAP